MPFSVRELRGRRATGEVRAAAGGTLVALMLLLFVAIRLDPAGGSRESRVTAVGVRTLPAYWVVQAGDTFGLIARRTGLSVVEIEALNPHADAGSLAVGERIVLRRP